MVSDQSETTGAWCCPGCGYPPDECGCGKSQTTAILLEIVRLARELVATADLSEPRGMTTTVSSDHFAELMEALEAAENV